jgi:hypothetical protein
MKEIKFRGYSEELKCFVYGFYHEVEAEGIGYSYIFWQGHTTPVRADTIGQFTGLYDKNNKEIFENDIVKEGNYNSKVEWTFEASCSCCNTASGYYWSDDEAKNLEVVGNSYENPQLLSTPTADA